MGSFINDFIGPIISDVKEILEPIDPILDALLMDIPLMLTVELGTTKKRVRDLLKMGHGSVVGLSQLEGEPVDLLVNNTLVAKGEVQVEKEKYNIRIVEVVSRMERVKSLE